MPSVVAPVTDGATERESLARLRDYRRPRTGKCLVSPCSRQVHRQLERADPGVMTLGDVAAGIGALVITACLLSIVLSFFLWVGVSVLTVARARRRVKRRPELLTGLAHGCTVSDLAEIDDELAQVLAQEHWRWPAEAYHGA